MDNRGRRHEACGSVTADAQLLGDAERRIAVKAMNAYFDEIADENGKAKESIIICLFAIMSPMRQKASKASVIM